MLQASHGQELARRWGRIGLVAAAHQQCDAPEQNVQRQAVVPGLGPAHMYHASYDTCFIRHHVMVWLRFDMLSKRSNARTRAYCSIRKRQAALQIIHTQLSWMNA